MPFLIPAAVSIGGAIAGKMIGGHSSSGGGSGASGLEKTFLDFANSEEKKKMGLMDENEGFLNFFSGDPTKSPLYSAYKTSDTEATASAYDNAVSNMKMRANERGFGYTSPVEAGGEDQIRGEEAAQIGRIPGRALTQTVDEGMKAAGIRAGEAASLNPAAWGGNITELEKAKQARSASLWSSLIGLGSNIGGQLIDKWGSGGGMGSGSSDSTDS